MYLLQCDGRKYDLRIKGARGYQGIVKGNCIPENLEIQSFELAGNSEYWREHHSQSETSCSPKVIQVRALRPLVLLRSLSPPLHIVLIVSISQVSSFL